MDEILGGGLPRGHVYLVQGESGAGKTTLALHFLIEGLRRGEKTLWITLSETERELAQIAGSHGWSIEGTRVCAPLAPNRQFDPDQQYSFFSPADVELDQLRHTIIEAIDEVRPARVVIDPFSDVRHLARDVLRYRREVLALREHFNARGCTVLLVQELIVSGPGDLQAEALVHGYMTLSQEALSYGGLRRRIQVHKMRGIAFRDGYHDFTIRRGGITIYPRLVAAEHEASLAGEQISSGVSHLDSLLGGGVERGSSMLVMGAAGTGKSTLATHYATEAARRGERTAFFAFDETARTLRTRSARLGLDLETHLEAGTIVIDQIDSAEYTAGQFTHMVRMAVEEGGAKLVVIDSLSGYMTAMAEDRFLTAHLHELLSYLSYRNVVTIFTVAQHGMIGENVVSPIDVSYLADTVVVMRYFEAFGAIRRAISVVKKRAGAHEVYVRELTFGPSGIVVGEPLRQFQGVLTGAPRFAGDSSELADDA